MLKILCKIWDMYGFCRLPMVITRSSRRFMHQKTAANHHKMKPGKAVYRKIIPEMLPVKTERLWLEE